MNEVLYRIEGKLMYVVVCDDSRDRMNGEVMCVGLIHRAVATCDRYGIKHYNISLTQPGAQLVIL